MTEPNGGGGGRGGIAHVLLVGVVPLQDFSDLHMVQYVRSFPHTMKVYLAKNLRNDFTSIMLGVATCGHVKLKISMYCEVTNESWHQHA